MIIESFFLGKHEVCQAQWTRIMGYNPALGQPGVATLTKESPTILHPVENVTWHQCVEFCRRLGVQLPNQDQWEYGARSTGLLIWGDCDRIECLKGRENFADESLRKLQPDYAGAMSWNDGFQMHAPIGSLLPNAFGLHDMLGNVAEWCSDPYRLPREPSSVAASTPPPQSGPGSTERRRVIRGSSWQRGTREAACNYAAGMFPSALQSTLGLRVTRPVDR